MERLDRVLLAVVIVTRRVTNASHWIEFPAGCDSHVAWRANRYRQALAVAAKPVHSNSVTNLSGVSGQRNWENAFYPCSNVSSNHASTG